MSYTIKRAAKNNIKKIVKIFKIVRASGTSGTGLPVGGTVGQLIRKTSDVVNYASEWFTLTKDYIGLGNVTNDAQLKRAAADFDSFEEKLTVDGTDIILIEDSGDSLSKKKISAKTLKEYIIGLDIITWALDFVNQNATFDRESFDYTWGYDDDPSVLNSPKWIKFPKDIQAVEGSRVSLEDWGVLGDSFANQGEYQDRINNRSFITADKTGGVDSETLTQIKARSAAYVNGKSFVYVIVNGGVNDLRLATSDISPTMLSDLQDIVADIEAEGMIPIVTTIPPWKDSANWTSARQTYTDNYNGLVLDYAAANNYTVHDLKNILSDDGLTLKASFDSGDKLHPNTAGWNEMGDTAIALGVGDAGGPYTTFKDGSTMHPFDLVSTTTDGNIKIYKEFAERANSTPYTEGEEFVVLSDNNNWLWAICTTEGTTAAEQPRYIEGDIGWDEVTDGTAGFTVQGYATLHKGGTTIGPQVDNEIPDSREFDAATWINSGTVRTANQPGIDGVADKSYTLEDDNPSSPEFIYRDTAVSDDGNTHGCDVYIKKQNDETSYPAIRLSLIGGSVLDTIVHINRKTGEYAYQTDDTGAITTVENYYDHWKLTSSITNDTSGNTTLRSFIYPARGTVLGVPDASATGEVIVDQFDIRLNQNHVGTGIPTSGGAATKQDTSLSRPSENVLTIAKGAGSITFTPNFPSQFTSAYVFGSGADTNNRVGIAMNSASANTKFVNKVGGVSTVDIDHADVTTVGVPKKVEFYWDEDENECGVRSYDVGSVVPDYTTDTYSTINLHDNYHVGSSGIQFLKQVNGKILSARFALSKDDL
jgi:hypothetical protein